MLEITHLLAKHTHIIQVNKSVQTCSHLDSAAVLGQPLCPLLLFRLVKKSRAPADTRTRSTHKGPFDSLGWMGGRVGVFLGGLVWL